MWSTKLQYCVWYLSMPASLLANSSYTMLDFVWSKQTAYASTDGSAVLADISFLRSKTSDLQLDLSFTH